MLKALWWADVRTTVGSAVCCLTLLCLASGTIGWMLAKGMLIAEHWELLQKLSRTCS